MHRRLDGIRAKRSKPPKLSDEGIQQLEQELVATSAQATISSNELNHDINQLRTRARSELDVYRIVEDYSRIVMRSLEINKEVFSMALNIKDDLKELLHGRIDALKGGKNKGWFVAASFAMTLIFLLSWILFKQWIMASFDLPLP